MISDGAAGAVGRAATSGSPTSATRQALAGYHQVARAASNSGGLSLGTGDAKRAPGKGQQVAKVAIHYVGPPKNQFVAATR